MPSRFPWSSRRGAWAAAAVVLVACLAAGAAMVAFSSPSPAPSPSAVASGSAPAMPPDSSGATGSASATATATAEAVMTPGGPPFADLDGLPTTGALAHALPMAIMVDDNIHARPQAGMNAASIVYQAPADGGEVRYMLVFQEGASKNIGPVRSARPYFVRWATEYRALYGHFGGDANSLKRVIPALSNDLFNMDALGGGSCPYHRVDTNVAPYNAFTDSDALRTCATRLGYPATIQQRALRPFRADSASPSDMAAGAISVPYRHQVVDYAYDAASRSYLRSVDGGPQIDGATGERVTARNVVVLFQRLYTDPDGEPGANRPALEQVGSGSALVFNEGTVVQATWKKGSETDLTRLYDASGKEIQLVRGRIFVQVVATGTKVTYEAG